MTLGELLTVLDESGQTDGGAGGNVPAAALDLAVSGVAYDSRAAAPGSVFVALRGEKADGASFAGQAVAKGAIAVVAAGMAPASMTAPMTAPWIRVADDRRALAALSAAFYRHPSRELRVIGITGTNGKTTCGYLVREVFEAAGVPCGLMGTVHYRIGETVREASRTTPEATDLQHMLREMVDAGCGACAMEVSSHALSLKRAESTRFAAGVFTNLTRDHLDYHQDMDQYFQAKRRLFELLPAGAPSVVNVDDPRGAQLAAQFTPCVTYGVDRAADVAPVAMPASLLGLSFDVRTPAGPLRIESRLGGRFNVYNLLAAAATGVAAGLPLAAIEAGLARVTTVPGRFQLVSTPDDDVAVIVDYAHTDDALKNLLEAVRPIAALRLITVFGCGGDRDRTKRPLMGAVATRLSDVVVITSDNPRSEDPDAIIEDIARGVGQPADRSSAAAGGRTAPMCLRIADRRVAIERAVAEAESGDVVVVAGKGHEKYQTIREKTLPFDDVAVAQDALAKRRVRRVS
jgi:UDP-N-acetylmuramoyl-L-alanyl-D-glutamate--2,6-diaminopimelate ligase